MDDIKLIAEVYKLGFKHGFFTVDEILSWCDKMIEVSENPDIAIIETSLMKGADVNDIINSIDCVGGKVDILEVIKILLGLIYRKYKEGKTNSYTLINCMNRLTEYNLPYFVEYLPEIFYYKNIKELRDKVNEGNFKEIVHCDVMGIKASMPMLIENYKDYARYFDEINTKVCKHGN